jgi:hypothetical protein
MTGRFGLAALVAALALGGCSSVWVDDLSPPRYNYNNGDFEYATHKGAIVTQIVGNPFSIGDDQFRSATLAQMQGRNRGRPAKFVSAPSQETLAPYKVVAAFNMPPDITGYELCKGPGALPPSAKRTGQVTLGMAFCFGDDVKSDARGWVSDLRGIDDPRFAELVNRVTEAMLPARDGLDTFGDANPP